MTEPNFICSLLVIGYGNVLRGDDAAGPLVAEAVSEWKLPGVRALAVHQLTPELVEQIAVADRVVFVDASIDPSLTSLRVEELQPRESSLLLGHCSDPQWLLALTRELYEQAPPGLLVTIAASNLDAGSPLSSATRKGVQAAVQLLARLAHNDVQRGQP